MVQEGAFSSTISGGEKNTIGPNAMFATIPGGFANVAGGPESLAAGSQAQALHAGAFVWSDSTAGGFASTGSNQFCIRATGGVQLSGDTTMSFGSTLSPKINLYSTSFGIGIQSGVQYYRVAAGGAFAWFSGGVHNDNTYNPGGGTSL